MATLCLPDARSEGSVIVKQPELWYRLEDYEDTNVQGVLLSMNDSWLRGGPAIRLFFRTFGVVRHTPKGVWLNEYGVQRFVLKDARKRYAYPTKELALESYRKRRESYIKRLKNYLHRAEGGLAVANALTAAELEKLRQQDESPAWTWGSFDEA